MSQPLCNICKLVLTFHIGAFDEIEETYPQLVAIDSEGKSTGFAIDFREFEKQFLIERNQY